MTLRTGLNGQLIYILLLLVCSFSVCAEITRYTDQNLDYTLEQFQPAASQQTTETDRAVTKAEYLQQKKRAEQRVIVSGNRLALTPELEPIKAAVDQLQASPADLGPMAVLQHQPERLAAYIERQFYNNTELSQQVAYIELFTLVLGNPAVPVLIDWSRKLENPVITQAVIHSVAELKPIPSIREFINELLDNELQHPAVIRSALSYHVRWPDASSMRWVIQFRNPHIAADIRYIALSLAARVGDRSAAAAIIRLLEQPAPVYQRYDLHLALTHLLDTDQYRQLAASLPLDDATTRSIDRQLAFRSASDQQRVAMLDAMLNDYFRESRDQALAYLIETSAIERLQRLLHTPEALRVYRRTQQAGIELDIEGGAVHSAPSADTTDNTPTDKRLLWALLLTVALTAVFILIKRRTGSARLHIVS